MAERNSSSLQRGLALSMRKPLANTSPNAEFFSRIDTTSGPGTPLRVTVITSSSSLGGATFWVLRLIKRSITRASANIEQAIRGQIGQPAACMMENNVMLRSE